MIDIVMIDARARKRGVDLRSLFEGDERALIARAISEGLSLVMRDGKLGAYEVKVLSA